MLSGRNPGNGKEAAIFAYVMPFLMSTLCGTVIAAFLIGVLCKSGAFKYMKQLLDANAIGRLIHMDLIENVAYWHFAHSYVPGNWRPGRAGKPHDSCKKLS